MELEREFITRHGRDAIAAMDAGDWQRARAIGRSARSWADITESPVLAYQWRVAARNIMRGAENVWHAERVRLGLPLGVKFPA